MADDLAASGPGPNRIDAHVGARVRLHRKMRGLSQEALAQRLGLTFQQVQKYERGAHRISASKLYEIARALEVPVAALFDGAPGPGPTDADSRLKGTVERLMLEDGGAELAELYPRIRSPDVRRALVRMVRAVVEGQALP